VVIGGWVFSYGRGTPVERQCQREREMEWEGTRALERDSERESKRASENARDGKIEGWMDG